MGIKVAMLTSWHVKCGIASYTEHLSQALAKEGVEVFIVPIPRFGIKTKETFQAVIDKIPKDKVDLIHCFPKGNKILTNQGITDISEVQKGDNVYTHKGRIRKVTNIFSREYDGEIIELKGQYNQKIKCTPEHPFLIVHNPWTDNHITRLFVNKRKKRIDSPNLIPQWVKASEINIGDYIAFPRIKVDLEKTMMYELPINELSSRHYIIREDGIYSQKSKKRLCYKNIVMNGEVMRLLGYYIAEGCASQTKLGFSFNIKETEYVADIEEIMLKTIGCQHKPHKAIDGNGLCISYSNRPLIDLIISLCGKGARKKHLPSWTLTKARDEELINILKGIYLGDGTAERDGFSITTYSETLREQIRLAYNRLGMAAGVYETTVKVRGAGIKIIEHLFNIKHSWTSKHNFRDFAYVSDDYIYYKIRKKNREMFKGVVYNIEVETDNSYLIYGYTSHNCQHEYGYFQNFDQTFFQELKLLGKPIVTTLHAWGNPEMDYFIAHSSDRVVVHNHYCASGLLKNAGMGTQICIVPHGCDPVESMPDMDKAKTQVGVPVQTPIVGYCGFVSRVKGLEALIEAVRRVPYVKYGGNRVSLGLMIGGGAFPDNAQYYNGIREKSLEILPKRIRWLGFVSDEDLPNVYASIDLLVYPSQWATESGALLMAVSHGRAVLASRLPPFLEKEKQGALMTFRNVDDLANKIRLMFRKPELRAGLEKGAMEYARKYSWQNIARMTKALYEDVLAEQKK